MQSQIAIVFTNTDGRKYVCEGTRVDDYDPIHQRYVREKYRIPVFTGTAIVITAAQRLPQGLVRREKDVVDVDAAFAGPGASTNMCDMFASVQEWFSQGYTFVERYVDAGGHEYLRMRRAVAPAMAQRLGDVLERLVAAMESS
jgi:hypothetical protein